MLEAVGAVDGGLEQVAAAFQNFAVAAGDALDGVVLELDGGVSGLIAVGKSFERKPPGGEAGDRKFAECGELIASVEGAIALVEEGLVPVCPYGMSGDFQSTPRSSTNRAL